MLLTGNIALPETRQKLAASSKSLALTALAAKISEFSDAADHVQVGTDRHNAVGAGGGARSEQTRARQNRCISKVSHGTPPNQAALCSDSCMAPARSGNAGPESAF